MARPSTIFKRSANLLLRHIAENLAIGEALPTEHRMAELGQGSRTAVRSALDHFLERGLISDLKERRVLRKPQRRDYFALTELQTGADRIHEVLMERIYQSDLPPGSEFSEAELARAAGTSTVSVREFLIGFSRSGLIEKKPRGGWRLCAFDHAFAMELADVRQMFEFAAVEHLAGLPPDDAAFATLADLIARHEQLGSVMPARHKDFPALDRDFHTFLIGLLANRFAQNVYEIVSLVFHYHYQWDKREEMERNQYAVQEHLAILRALARRDAAGAREAMRTHLDSASRTLLLAIQSRETRHHPG
ncbi:GntR family transcriptional regulator [Pseudoduganella namucuonensis]|uniref:Transcriptional regulator, GntR family n=1 Tax=Pseudoduganella namucuonensis TaxID=1035707 RepID=A0A1I7JZW0_9BURK|nr:GntR family transcriptional regulator [Pseudoduganella namucuonensis]SFU90692.1 transcriptional regulator, GntR family [Pseudoduganella namucuonensis]